MLLKGKKKKKNTEKYLWKSSCSCLFFKDFTKIENHFFQYFWNSRIATVKEQLIFLNKNSKVFETKNWTCWTMLFFLTEDKL